MTTDSLNRRRLLTLGLAPLPALAMAACGGGELLPEPYATLALPTPLSQHSAAVLDGARVALAGGSRGLGVLSSSVNVLDSDTGAWTERARMTTGRAEARLVALGSARLFVHGGARSLTGSRTAEWVDLVAGTSTPAAASPSRLRHTATRLLDGRILVAGGLSTEGHVGGVSPSLELWDPATGQWRYAARPLQQARQSHTATLLPDGSVLFVGGYAADGMAASAERFDPATETLTTFASPLLARAGHGAALQRDGRVLVAGGEQGAQARPVAPGAVWMSASPWNAAAVQDAPDLLPMEAAGAAVGDGLVLTGGLDPDGRAVAAVWAIGAASRRWAPLPEPRAWHSATALPGGGLLIVGGEREGRLHATALRLA